MATRFWNKGITYLRRVRGTASVQRRRVLLGLLLLLPGGALLAQPQASEYEVKAAFLYNFASYVEWPAAALPEGQPLVFGVAGAEEVADFLETLAQDRRIRDRPFEVRRLAPGASAAGLHVLFIGRERRDGEALLDNALTLPILTVSEAPDQHPPGSTINFRLDEGRVRFDISLPTARTKGLSISSRLLAIAQQIIGQTPQVILMLSWSADS